MQEKNDLKGLSGWLILIGIGVVVSPFKLMFEFVPLYTEIFVEGYFDLLTDSSSEVYNPFWGPFIIGEMVFNGLITLLSFYLIYLYFTKHYLFPKVYIGLLLASLIFIPLDAWIGSFVITDEAMFTPEIITDIVRTAVASAIWIPYMLLSVRVAQTFVAHRPTRLGRSIADDAVMMATSSSNH